MKKSVCWCSILLLLLIASPARAAEPLAVHAEDYLAQQGTVRLYWNTNLERVPTASEIALQVGNQTLPIAGIETFGQTGEGATYLFLIDISGSIGVKKSNAIKQTLLSVISGMEDQDNAGMLLVGDEVEIQALTADKAALAAQIEGIASGTKSTNLYLGITKGLDLLASDAKSNPKKCLIVLSDGEDYAVKGITREEVEKKVSLLRIPVYTVAMLGENPQGSYVESAKILGSFARLSPGGMDLVHDLKEETSKAAAQDIRNSVSSSLVLTADLTGLAFAGNEQYLQLELNAGTAGKASDGYNIATGTLTAAQLTPAPSATPAPTPVATPDATATPVPTATPAPAAAPTFLGLPVLWAAIGGGALVLILAVLLILLGKRRKKTLHSLAGFPEPQDDTMQFSDLDRNAAAPFGDTIPLQQMDTISLRFTRVGPNEGQVYHATLGNPVVIGRKADLATLAFPEDDLLSGRHCEIIRRDSGLFINDLGSTNKTYVNGVMIVGYHKLEQDDVIYIGSMELRISWDANSGL